MKFCPVCQTKYDEEIIKFCTKDGTPLAEENPSFTAMPSESSIDDLGEETLIGMKKPVIPPTPIPEVAGESGQRIVIPTTEEKKQEVRPLDRSQHQPPPRKSNTALVVLLTIFLTLIVLGGAFGVWWFVLRDQRSTAGNSNKNTNTNGAANNSNLVNDNTTPYNFNGVNSSGSNSNANSNANTNVNANANSNANKTPSPTKTPSPSPSPSPTFNENLNINSNRVVNISPSNTNSPTATPTPKPSPTAPTPPQNVNVGVMNSRATTLPRPAYPPAAKQMNASGQVNVQVSIDEDGNVLSAKAISGHPLLRAPAEAAARQSHFIPVKIGDRNVRANGTVVYNFINQ